MSELKRVIVEIQSPAKKQQLVPGMSVQAAAPIPSIPGLKLDVDFKPVPIVSAEQPAAGMAFAALNEDEENTSEFYTNTYIVRGTLDAGADPKAVADQLKKSQPNVVGVYSDVAIQPMLICPGSAPLGTDTDVEHLLNVHDLARRHMNGHGVTVAIVDTGINLAYLRSRGKTPRFSAAKSWVPSPGLEPGNLPVDHGTMCAFDVCIAAPKCTLIDIALLQSTAPGGTVMEGFLSDAVRAYRHLLDLMLAPRRPGENHSLVVNNSWGMFNPSWDYPVGDPGNYSDNLNHPFNRIVTALERAGADILFAAGNCGADCADGRCDGVVDRAIYGANSHPRVLSIAGVDVTKQRVGYSSIGPGRLVRRKPDLCGFTHFEGSGVYAADGGTSAATPVVTGLVAALRSRLPFRRGLTQSSPARVRNLLRKTAEDVGGHGYDFKHGYGIANGTAVARVVPIAEPVAAAAALARPTAAGAHCAECGSPLRAPAASRPAAEPVTTAPDNNGHSHTDVKRPSVEPLQTPS